MVDGMVWDHLDVSSSLTTPKIKVRAKASYGV